MSIQAHTLTGLVVSILMTYLYCRHCNKASRANSTANRPGSIVINPEITPDKTLGKPHSINLLTALQKTQDDTHHSVGSLRQQFSVIIDRLLPILLLRDGWENLGL